MRKETPCIVATRIKARRQQLSKTQDVLAHSTGLSRKTINSLEKMSSPTLMVDTFMKLCSALDCSADYLLGIDDFPNHETTDVHRITGLSEKAIEKLHATDYSDILSLLIEDINYEYLLSLVSKRVKNYDPKALKKRTPKELLNDDLWIDLDGQRVLTYKRNMLDSLIQSELSSMIHVIAEEYHREKSK